MRLTYLHPSVTMCLFAALCVCVCVCARVCVCVRARVRVKRVSWVCVVGERVCFCVFCTVWYTRSARIQQPVVPIQRSWDVR